MRQKTCIFLSGFILVECCYMLKNAFSQGTLTHCFFSSSNSFGISSVQLSRSVVSDSLRPHESQHTRPPCPSPTPGVHSDSRPSSPWCHPVISSSVVPFSSCPQSLPASQSFPVSQLYTQALCLSDLIPWIYLSLPLYNHKGFDLGHTWMVQWFSLLSFNRGWVA